MRDTEYKILLTGFEPFGDRSVNNSWEVAKKFDGASDIDVLKLPVSFNRAHRIVEETLKKQHYDLILLLGETSATTDYVRMERLAINYKDSTRPDNEGYIADDEVIVENAPKAYFSSLPIKRYVRHLKELGHKVRVSNSSGTFVCNSLYYHVLRYLEENSGNTSALFLHLPVATKIVTLEEMTSIIAAILSIFNKNSVTSP